MDIQKNKNNINPWEKLNKEEQIRVSSTSIKNIYWGKDSNSNYVLLFKLERTINKIPSIKVKGLSIYSKMNELGIFLLEKDKWELFKILCDDLINVTKDLDNESKIISDIFFRLEEWKRLFSMTISRKMSLEEQMGLYSELSFLKENLIPVVGIKQALESWRGPSGDSQDFLSLNSAIEIKSCVTSRGRIATISNWNQLETDKDKLYLVHYCLTPNSKGESIDTIIKEIIANIENEEDKILLEKKLIESKIFFINSDHDEDVYRFLVDKISYYQVSEEFPKISLKNYDKRIKSIKYEILLSLCDEFFVEKQEVIDSI